MADDEYLNLPYVTVRFFIQPGDLVAAETRLHTLRGGDKRIDIAVAAGYARGYEVEYAEADEQPATAPPMTVRRSPFGVW